VEPSIKVEPTLVQQFAANFGDLVAAFDGLGTLSTELGDTGDARLEHAIEQFLAASRGGIEELSSQFGQVQRVLAATLQGYEAMEQHVVAEIEANL
jgi:hypothetical protein